MEKIKKMNKKTDWRVANDPKTGKSRVCECVSV